MIRLIALVTLVFTLTTPDLLAGCRVGRQSKSFGNRSGRGQLFQRNWGNFGGGCGQNNFQSHGNRNNGSTNTKFGICGPRGCR